MKGLKKKEVLYCEIGDFFVEAEYDPFGDDEVIDFWLGRKNYGIKTGMFGIPKKEVLEGKIENAFAEYLELFCDRDYMSIFVEELTEDGEIIDWDLKIR